MMNLNQNNYKSPRIKFCFFCEKDISDKKNVCHSCGQALTRETKQPTKYSIIKFRRRMIDKQNGIL